MRIVVSGVLLLLLAGCNHTELTQRLSSATPTMPTFMMQAPAAQPAESRTTRVRYTKRYRVRHAKRHSATRHSARRHTVRARYARRAAPPVRAGEPSGPTMTPATAPAARAAAPAARAPAPVTPAFVPAPSAPPPAARPAEQWPLHDRFRGG